MKLPHLSIAASLLALACTIASATGCNRQHGDDWRHPPPPRPCATDADCPGGSCTLEVGAAQGSCGPAGGVRPQSGDDGGAYPGQPPLLDVQPSPSDIKI